MVVILAPIVLMVFGISGEGHLTFEFGSRFHSPFLFFGHDRRLARHIYLHEPRKNSIESWLIHRDL